MRPIHVLLLTLPMTVSTAQGAVHSQDGERLDPRAEILKENDKLLCRSTDEFVRTLTWLRESKDVILPERTARLIAEKVSRGCDGAAKRFRQTLRLLRGIGLSEPKSLELALEFSSQTPQTQKNFLEVFNKAFLGEFFDFDYATAVALAFELSRDYEGDPIQVREDFIALARFCRESKSLDLPTKICSAFAVKMARLSQFYVDGVRSSFLNIFKKLREDREFSMDIKTALEFSYNILKHGPRAPENFLSGYAFAMKESGLAMGRNQALEFGLKMAARSFIGDEPPTIPAAENAQPL